MALSLPFPNGKSVRIFDFNNISDIQALEAREKFCAKLKIVLKRKDFFLQEKNFQFGAERFLYVSFLKIREANGRQTELAILRAICESPDAIRRSSMPKSQLNPTFRT